MYDFTLKYRLSNPADEPERYLAALAESGCEDARVGIGQNGRIVFNFIRDADSALDAIMSAIADVQQAIPDARLVEAVPDFVGVTDIAGLLGFSRQYMRKIIQTEGASFPEPVHEGKLSLWHLADVFDWFRRQDCRAVESQVYEVSKINMQLNIYRDCLKATLAFSPEFRNPWLKKP